MEVKLEDVAKRVGMSKSTVSLALNGSEKVNLETRKRILQTAQEMGYSPNPHARKLVMRKSNMIGLIVPDIQNVYYASLVDSISRGLRNSGYGLFIAISENSRKREKQIVQEMIQNRMDGVLLVPLNKPNDDVSYLAALEAAEIPMVYVTSVYPSLQRPYVMCNLYSGMRMMVRLLHGEGHRKIALMTGPSDVYCMDQREMGYREELKALRLTYENIMRLEEVTYASALSRIQQLPSPDMDAIVCVNDMMALGVINALNADGIKVPEDIAVAGYDDLIFSRISAIPITTVKQDLAEVANLSTRMLLGLIESFDTEKEAVIDCELIIRDSTTRHGA